MFNIELTKEEKRFLCEAKHINMDIEELDERIEMHNESTDEVLHLMERKERNRKRKLYKLTHSLSNYEM